MSCPIVLDYYVPQPRPVRIIQEKLNGYCVELVKKNGSISAALRGGRDIWEQLKKIPTIASAVVTLPDNTTLFCELHCPGLKSAAVITLLNTGDGRLQLTPFAAGLYDGRGIEFVEFMDVMNHHGITPARCIQYSARPFIPDAKALLKQIQSEGIEGYVLKESHLKGWFRLKPEYPIDVFVVDFELSNSKSFCGGLKSFVVAVRDGFGIRVLANVSLGFDHEFKKTCDPKAFIGRVMEVSYSDILAKGRLQIPKFVRWREDKTETECTISQVA